MPGSATDRDRNPFGIGSTVTAGIVSALHRVTAGAYDRFIQTDAAINRAIRGPMFDMNGNVIGINSQISPASRAAISASVAIPPATPPVTKS